MVLLNLPLAFSGAILSLIFGLISEWGHKNIFSLFVFFGIVAIYNLHKYYKLKIEYKASSRVRYFGFFGFVALLVSMFLFIQLFNELFIISVFSIAMIIAVWYVLPLFGVKLRQIKFLKGILVALVWTIVVTWTPLFQSKYIHVNASYYLLGTFFYILALTIPFDVRDIKLDGPKKYTLPQLVGVSIAKKISVGFVVLALLCTIHLNWISIMLSLVLLTVYGILLYYQKAEMRSGYYLLFDSMILVYAGLLFYCV